MIALVHLKITRGTATAEQWTAFQRFAGWRYVDIYPSRTGFGWDVSPDKVADAIEQAEKHGVRLTVVE